ncbi:MAG: hypothetical protein V4773_00370 [Verrucomicrobiota bacterium]
MLVRFTKGPAAATTDSLTCVRTDGSTTTAEMPRQGILPHLAFHFVIESAMDWHDALFGRVAAGVSLDELAERLKSPDFERMKNTQAFQCEALIECLEAEQWGGASDPVEFAQRLLRACHQRAVTPPDIMAEEVERIRHALREFGAAWRPLAPGASLERIFGT